MNDPRDVEAVPGCNPTEPSGETPPSVAPAPHEIPNQFGRYRILQPLGKGGMGTVYLAHDPHLDRKIALKVPLFDPQEGTEPLERFFREARAAATLDHPNICPVYDVGEAHGRPFLTMAFIDGQPLSHRLQTNGPMPQREAAALVRKLALALQEAHNRGIIHRDLKPSNIMINRRGEPIIMDFGLAKRVFTAEGESSAEQLTRTGLMLGTPAYMPPEQVRGQQKEIGPWSDIYSLGVLLYELLTGTRPFRGALADVLSDVLHAEPVPPSLCGREIDSTLESICLKAMAKKPADRYGSMAELAKSLADYLHGQTAKPVGQPTLVRSAADETAPAHRLSQQLRERQQASRMWLAIIGILVFLSAMIAVAIFLVMTATSPKDDGGRAKNDNRSKMPHTIISRQPLATPASHPSALGERDQQTVANLLFQAQTAYDNRDYARAIDVCTQALKLDARNVEALRIRAEAYGDSGQWDYEIDDCTRALAIDAYHVQLFLDRGYAYLNSNQPDKFDRCIADCNAALRLDPKRPTAYANRGWAYNGKLDYQDALDDFNTALAMSPAIPLWYVSRGVIHARRGERANALADQIKALQLDPKISDHFIAKLLRELLLAWPEDALRKGRIKAPDLSKAKRLQHVDFANPNDERWYVGGDQVKRAEYVNGIYTLRHMAGSTGILVFPPRSWREQSGDFACEVVGRLRRTGEDRWYIAVGRKEIWISLFLRGDGKLQLTTEGTGVAKGGGPQISPTPHRAIKSASDFNALLAIFQNGQLQVYVNGVAVCDPVRFDGQLFPVALSIGVLGPEDNVAEFQRVTVWSAEGLPTPQERMAKGEVPATEPVKK
jgi:serine/threonine protein kinase/Tfp pilus assembly protein PilF